MSIPEVIPALDIGELTPAHKNTLKLLAPHCPIFKLGHQAYFTEDLKTGKTVARITREYIQQVLERDVMDDVKLHEVQSTVRATLLALATHAPKIITVHAQMSGEALEAAGKLAKSLNPKVLVAAVTVLTDISHGECDTRFHENVTTVVRRFARLAFNFGIRSFVCSVDDAADIRELFAEPVVIISPGIRPQYYPDDGTQKRIATPAKAARAGVDYAVIGKPIFNPPGSMSPLDAVLQIKEEMRAAVA